MRSLDIFLYEWKHFSRNPFKVVALLLYIIAGVYGLHNGASLYHKQVSEIEKIDQKNEEERQTFISYFEEGKKGPEDRPWVDISTPFWAIWHNTIYHFKRPSAAIVYSIGQAEQYGFYKRVTFNASPYDADMSEEIANPERLQTGTLDYAFVLLFLSPLLLLILLYNLKSAESEQGFLPLIEVQVASKNIWLVVRILFYAFLFFMVNLALIVYGAMLTKVFATANQAFMQMVFYALLSLLFWTSIFYFILNSSQTIISSTLKMISVWLLFAFIIPAAIHQWVSIEKPVNLMTDLIDASRDERQALYQQPKEVIHKKLYALFPEIENSPVATDETKINMARNRSYTALVNELVKSSIADIESNNKDKNQLIRATYLFNPITFFQNKVNRISKTHYDDYQDYRNEIQTLVDRQIQTLVLDMWNDVQVDQKKYGEYYQELSTL